MSSTRAFVKHLLAGHLASTVAGAGLTFGEAETRCLNPISIVWDCLKTDQ